jgi:hypothetical protein
VRRGVDKVGAGHQGGGQPDHGPVESDHEDLGVLVEGARRVEVEGDEGLEQVLAGIDGGLTGGGGGDVGAAERMSVSTADRGGICSISSWRNGPGAYAEKNRPVPITRVM